MNDRICYHCGSDTTYIKKNGREDWYKYKDGYICKRCYCKLIQSPRYRDNNLDDIRERLKKWQLNNKDKISDYARKWRNDNPDKVKSQNAKFNPINNPKDISFKGKHICLKENPRIDVCNLCRAVVPFDCKRTSMHHVEYHDDDPLRDIIETCNKCHKKEHVEMRNKK